MTACPDRQMMLHALLDDELDAANAARLRGASEELRRLCRGI